jgi:hypothetical protein
MLFGAFFDVPNLMEVARRATGAQRGGGHLASRVEKLASRPTTAGRRFSDVRQRTRGIGDGIASTSKRKQKPREGRASVAGNGVRGYSATLTDNAATSTSPRGEERHGGCGTG